MSPDSLESSPSLRTSEIYERYRNTMSPHQFCFKVSPDSLESSPSLRTSEIYASALRKFVGFPESIVSTPFPPRILAKFTTGRCGIGIPIYLRPLNIIYLHQPASRSHCKNWAFSRSRFAMGASHFTSLEFEHATKNKTPLCDIIHEASQNDMCECVCVCSIDIRSLCRASSEHREV